MSKEDHISIEKLEKAVYLIRGERVMLDRDLAELYQVQTRALNQAVRRHPDRFPADFMFQLTEKEVAELNRSQFVTGSQKHRDPRSRPYVFTAQGVAMLSQQVCDHGQHRNHSQRQFRVARRLVSFAIVTDEVRNCDLKEE